MSTACAIVWCILSARALPRRSLRGLIEPTGYPAVGALASLLAWHFMLVAVCPMIPSHQIAWSDPQPVLNTLHTWQFSLISESGLLNNTVIRIAQLTTQTIPDASCRWSSIRWAASALRTVDRRPESGCEEL
jgi:hypothetical protein